MNNPGRYPNPVTAKGIDKVSKLELQPSLAGDYSADHLLKA
jgi:hypothetical protein